MKIYPNLIYQNKVLSSPKAELQHLKPMSTQEIISLIIFFILISPLTGSHPDLEDKWVLLHLNFFYESNKHFDFTMQIIS